VDRVITSRAVHRPYITVYNRPLDDTSDIETNPTVITPCTTRPMAYRLRVVLRGRHPVRGTCDQLHPWCTEGTLLSDPFDPTAKDWTPASIFCGSERLERSGRVFQTFGSFSVPGFRYDDAIMSSTYEMYIHLETVPYVNPNQQRETRAAVEPSIVYRVQLKVGIRLMLQAVKNPTQHSELNRLVYRLPAECRMSESGLQREKAWRAGSNRRPSSILQL